MYCFFAQGHESQKRALQGNPIPLNMEPQNE